MAGLTRTLTSLVFLLLTPLIILCGLSAQAGAKTLHVAANGIDTLTCGSKTDPCRSIGRTVVNAGVDDRILVRPGRYGVPSEVVSAVCNCMILIDKRLTMVSAAGSLATIIDAGQAIVNAVGITASGVHFGSPGHGFTVTRAGRAGILVDPSATGVMVAGNVATFSTAGFEIHGTGQVLEDNLATANNGDGYSINDKDHVLRRDVATANSGNGFVFADFSGSGYRAEDNLAISNNDAGFRLLGTGHRLKSNAVLGNKTSGFVIQSGDARITGNNIYANGIPTNCGLTISLGT